jgi:antitoxin Phd
METIWQLQDAKSELNALVENALTVGPQLITRRGVDTVVVISYVEYQQMRFGQQKLSEFFRQSPFVEVELDIERDKSLPRPDLEL